MPDKQRLSYLNRRTGILGPILGAITVLFFLAMNQPLGASGAYIHTMNYVRRSGDSVTWRVWYFVGIAFGGFVVTQFLQDIKGLRTGFDSFRMQRLYIMVPALF